MYGTNIKIPPIKRIGLRSNPHNLYPQFVWCDVRVRCRVDPTLENPNREKSFFFFSKMSKGAEGGATAANKLCIWSDAIKPKRLCRFSPWRVVVLLLLLLLSNSGWNNIMTPRFCVFGKRGRTVGSHSRPPTKQSTTIEIIWWPSHTQGHISNSGALKKKKKKNRRWGSWASGRHNFTKKKWHGECRDIITQVEIFFSFLFPQTDIVMRTNEVSQSSLRIPCWGYIAPEKGNCGNWSHSDDDEQGASGSSPFCLLLSLAHRLPPIVNPISTHLTAAADQTQMEVQRANIPIPASAAKKTASSACRADRCSLRYI